ncbi:teichoic acid transport system permease protein [Paenibacillus castaneae]|uniref:ABC transporter permease n=1 Tax=Paenibacillus castaneae TaxID=474957 RepID=UPI000C9A7A3B|nr:ABC transporter permease [Paenibacillus castaneae]NIK78351.1 teichoic acid transport system permease protein [Paenibacillus castaneae]
MKNIKTTIRLIFELSKNDFKVRYAASYLGIVWGIANPLITLLVYWFVFEIGFRSGARPDGTPFIVWLACGMVMWFLVSESVSTSSNSFLEYSYLVKKVSFRIGILPIVKIISSLYNHIIFLIILGVILLTNGVKPDITNIQFLYYLFCSIYLLTGIGLITSSLVVFIRDIGQLVGIAVQIGFWLIPIVWSSEIIPDKYIYLFKLNPVYYLVEGYRDTFIENVWFWHRYNQSFYFWCISTIILFIGYKLFKRLKPHFADVL